MSSSEVERGKRYIINVGSVGQPRNRDRRLSFGIFDDDRWEYEHVVAEYDAGLAREKIIEAGLPPYLGDRLLAGV
jgi:diadenosine tetraphosphatase ApaH/serine/threonine PP2A family protein phosphatase